MWQRMSRWAGVYKETPDRNDLKHGTVVVHDTVSQPTDFGFKKAKVEYIV